jgi:hypothetical protein
MIMSEPPGKLSLLVLRGPDTETSLVINYLRKMFYRNYSGIKAKRHKDFFYLRKTA